MSGVKATESPAKGTSGSGAESPTTVRPLDMDDDDVQDVPLHSPAAVDPSAPTDHGDNEAAPPKPPRPISAQQQAENTLKEAFPTIDAAVVRAVLRASGGNVEPAFNALLEMSDPDAVVESDPAPPPQPPRPVRSQMGSTPQTQLEADELYARRLAEQYDANTYGGQQRAPMHSGGRSRQPQETGLKPNELYDNDHSFLDDDLPVIKESLRKGFVETQKTVNSWITNLKKKLDGEEGEGEAADGSQRPAQPYPGHSYGPRRSADSRRSGDYNRYDADPQVLGDDFAGINLHEDPGAVHRSSRPLANPDLFKPTPKTPRSSDGRKVAFQSGPPEDMDAYRASPKQPATGTPSSGKQSKWQPLSAVDPSPVGESDNDPFSLGDSEDEKESKDRVGGKEVRTEDTERLKQAAAASSADPPARKLEPAETSGTKDKLAEEALQGKS